MSKILFNVEDDLEQFLREDAKTERRTISAQLNMLLELCKNMGGYRQMNLKLEPFYYDKPVQPDEIEQNEYEELDGFAEQYEYEATADEEQGGE